MCPRTGRHWVGPFTGRTLPLFSSVCRSQENHFWNPTATGSPVEQSGVANPKPYSNRFSGFPKHRHIPRQRPLAASRCRTVLLKNENQMMLSNEAPFVADGPWFRSPKLKSIPFIKTTRCLRSLTHAEVYLTDLKHPTSMANRSRK